VVLAIGVGTTTMIGLNVGAGLAARARRVTLVSCGLAAAVFRIPRHLRGAVGDQQAGFPK
jgi:Na+-driven multidrug efflux pump